MIIERVKRLQFKSKLWKKKWHINILDGAKISGDSVLDGYNLIGSYSIINAVKMGKASYIGNRCNVYTTRIGKFTSIGDNVITAIGCHPTREWVSTHPAFFSTKEQVGFTFATEQKFEEIKWIDEDNKICIEIGNDVWIGSSVTIFDGVHIGDGAIIGAGSIVTKDVPDYSVVVGNPARIIKYRFNEDDIKLLKNIRWWDKPEEWIIDHAMDFKDISVLRARVEKEGLN